MIFKLFSPVIILKKVVGILLYLRGTFLTFTVLIQTRCIPVE